MMAPMRFGARVAIAAAAVALLGVTAGCSWRLETDPEPFRTPSPTTVMRDHLAAAEQTVQGAASASTGAVAETEAGLAPARIAALGGVSPTSSPRPTADLDAAVAAALAQADACAETAEDATLAGLCVSTALSHRLVAFAADPEPRGEPQVRMVDPAAGVLPEASTLVDDSFLAQVALAHDRARDTYQTIAARAKGEERTNALARGRLHRERVEQLLALGIDDLTEPAYDVPAARVADAGARATLARDTEWALGEDYARVLVTAEAGDRAWLTNAAYDAYTAASPTPGEIAALPGIAPAA